MRPLVGLASSCQPRYHLWGQLVAPNAAFTWLRTRWLAPLGLCLPKPCVLFQRKSRVWGRPPEAICAMFYQSTSDVFENSSRSHLSVKSQKSAGRKKKWPCARCSKGVASWWAAPEESGRDPSGWTSDAVLSKIIAYDHWHIFKWNTSLPKLGTR